MSSTKTGRVHETLKRHGTDSSDSKTEETKRKKAKRDPDTKDVASSSSASPSSTSRNKEIITFNEEELFRKGKFQINEEYGDLFEAPPDHSLAHCVAADMRMGSGIAVSFRQKFGHLGEILDQNKYIRDVAILKEGDRYIYNLVTKKFSNGKPELKDVHFSLEEMRKHCEENGVKNVSMPRIGCGLDRLKWDDVEEAIQNAFRDLDITITVHDFNPPFDYRNKKNLLRITQCNSLGDVPYGTAPVFCTSEDGIISQGDYFLLHHLNLYRLFASQNKRVGRLVKLTSWNKQNLFGLVVRKNEGDAFSYRNFEKCLYALLNVLKKQRIQSVAFESFNNSFTMAKVTSVIKHVFEFSRLNFYICKPRQVEVNKRWRSDSSNYTQRQY